MAALGVTFVLPGGLEPKNRGILEDPVLGSVLLTIFVRFWGVWNMNNKCFVLEGLQKSSFHRSLFFDDFGVILEVVLEANR